MPYSYFAFLVYKQRGRTMQLGRCLNGSVIPLLNSLAKELAQHLLDVFQQVVHVFQSYTQSDSRVQHVHLLAFFG